MTTADERRTTYRRAEDIYRKAIEEMRDYAIFMTDPDGIVTEWNVGAEHILGYSAEEIIGKDAAKLFTSGRSRPIRSGKRIADSSNCRARRRRTLARSS